MENYWFNESKAACYSPSRPSFLYRINDPSRDWTGNKIVLKMPVTPQSKLICFTLVKSPSADVLTSADHRCTFCIDLSSPDTHTLHTQARFLQYFEGNVVITAFVIKGAFIHCELRLGLRTNDWLGDDFRRRSLRATEGYSFNPTSLHA